MPPLLRSVFGDIRTRHYPKGQIIFYQGDLPLDVMILKSGVIKMYDTDAQGNEKVLHLLRPWAIFPLAFFSGNTDPTHWFYSALTDCDISTTTYENLVARMRADSDLAFYLTNWFSTEVHELLVRLSSLGKTNAHDKLDAALKFLALHFSVPRTDDWVRISFPVNHQLLADMTGITRESAAMIMKSMKDAGVIRQPRLTIVEINVKKLLQP